MILVDTSVLINFFRGRETAGTSYDEDFVNMARVITELKLAV
mgnify:CR=1 FL=1